MRGSIKKRGNRYVIRYDIGRDEYGKRIQKQQSFPNKKEAEEALNKIIYKIEKGEYYIPKDTLYSDYLYNTWIPTHCKNSNIKAKTLENYNFVIDHYISKKLGNIKIKDITPFTLQKFNSYLQNDLGLSGTTCLNCHIVIRESLKDAVNWQIINRNAADAIKRPKKTTPEMKVLDKDEVIKVLNALKNYSIYLIVLVDFNTGLRRGEILALTWKDIDFIKGYINVNKQLQKINNVLEITTCKSKSSVRCISIPDFLVPILLKEKEKQEKIKSIIGNKYEDNNLVFCQKNGKAYDPDYITRNFARKMEQISKEYNIPKIRFHDIRHTHATLLLEAGENISVVSKRLGHSKEATTLNIYSHVIPSMEKETKIRLNSLGLK